MEFVQALLERASHNLSEDERQKVKEVLVEHNENTFHNPQKHLTRTNTLGYAIQVLDLLLALLLTEHIQVERK